MVGGKIFDEDIYICKWFLLVEDILVIIFLKFFIFKNINKYIYVLI